MWIYNVGVFTTFSVIVKFCLVESSFEKNLNYLKTNDSQCAFKMMMDILRIITLCAVVCPLCTFLPVYFLKGILGTKDIVAANVKFQTLISTELWQNL